MKEEFTVYFSGRTRQKLRNLSIKSFEVGRSHLKIVKNSTILSQTFCYGVISFNI